MGKGSKKKRHQKKADFQKVKFKVGKKIPKGNVVDTTFKTKKILIREQLKATSDTGDNVSGNTVPKNIQEILKHVGHLNPSVRLNAVNDLKETLVARPDLLATHLNAIVGRIMSLCIDRELTIRKAAVVFLKHLFSSVESAQVVPHLHVIVTHVRCAMSHISQSIRANALQVVDLIVEHFGGSTEANRFSGQLLVDFVHQISASTSSRVDSVHSEAAASIAASNRRALTADPSSGVTSVAWHLQVSRRLRAILRNIWSQVNIHVDGESQNGQGCHGLLVTWDPQAPLHVPLRYKSIVSSANSVNRKDLDDFFDDNNQMSFLFCSLIPLLFEMWVEAQSLNTGLARNLVSGESLEVYYCIVDVIQLLHKLVDFRQVVERKPKECWLDKNFEQKFEAHLMVGFPYADHSAPLRKNKRKANRSSIQGHDAFSLNLSLCYIATCLDSFSKSQTSWLRSTVWKYIFTVVKGNGWHAVYADTVVHVLGKFLECKCKQTTLLLDAIYKLCSRFSVQRQERKQLLNLLHDLLTLQIYTHLHCDASLRDWVASLPEEILKYNVVIPWEILKIFQSVAYRGQPKFLSNVQCNMSAILDYVLQHASDDSDWDRNFKVIANLLYWIPQCDADILTKVAEVCADARLSVRHRNYVLHVLDGRFRRQSNKGRNTFGKVTAYTTFLTNIGQISD